ncbi:amino acid ABC transporter membrane protein 2, PAAT family [Rhizobiales bacterium GAS191]|nr:amino acid ABC transporter membrane protein 2, PAAT family [Rhizobiales bacterium GAS113]SEE29330.1 amino acid ABC transporter membrane protein 2, PAAT family [Rhizobiales bacterium GAS191]
MTVQMPVEAAAPPSGGFEGSTGGAARVFDWLRRNLFSSVSNALLTVLVVGLLIIVVPPVFNWAIADATISGSSKSACTGDGACWTFIKLRLHTFFWGHYPDAELWRVGLAAVLLVAFLVPVMRDQVRHRGFFLLLLLTVYPLLAGILLVGDVLGLPYVDTSEWGGLMLDVIISFVTVAGALPLGVLLALGRRSELGVFKYLSIAFIELWRGVPLLTVLFMSAVMVPLFLPHGVSIDRLLRAMVAFTLFNAAYMAETVRGGLQGVPVGQEEAASSLGLGWWHVQVFVTLPQALRIVVPGIVNNIVDLFKDTSLVTIIGLVDLLGAVEQSLKDPAWLGLAKEGYIFTAALFFVCCFAMSSYGRRFERRLNRHRTGAP